MRLATLDHLSAGRAAWNVVTSSDAFTGENFRRGGYLDRADRYTRAAEFVATARELWDSWTPDGESRPFAHEGPQFTISGEFTVPRSPQGHPVVIQAGDSDEGREFAASAADIIFTRHGTLEAGRTFYADVKARLAAYGREPGSLKIMPGVTVVVGDSDAEAQEKAAGIRRRAGLPAERDPHRRADLGHRPLRVRPRRAAPRDRPGSRLRDHPGPGPARRPLRDRRPLARARRGQGAVPPADGHRDDHPAVVHRLAPDRRGGADLVRRRTGRRRFHPRPPSHPERPGRLRRPGRPAPPGERSVPLRIHRLHAAVAPRPAGAGMERLTA